MRSISRLGILAVTAAFAAAACGDSSGPGVGPVALLTDVAFVDYDLSSIGSEASQMEFTIKSFGLIVTQVNAIDSTTLATELSGSGVFVVPEETGPVASTLTAGAKAVLRRFVDSTGGVLIVVPDDPGLALLDTLFDYAIVAGVDSAFTRLSPAASGTPFAGGPAIIWDNNGTYYIHPASLPPGGKAIYTLGSNSGASVAYIRQGRGVVVLLGWDWYLAAPHGPQDGGWIEVLRRALRS